MKLVYRGKVRDVYQDESGDELYLVASDRFSSFDRHICNVKGKGKALTDISVYWFHLLESHGIPTHLVSRVNATTLKVVNTTPIKLEFVVRGYLTGTTSTSIWTHYAKGERVYCGHCLPDGMVRNQRLDVPILTPTTKDEHHDRPVSKDEIVGNGILTTERYNALEDLCLNIFAIGQAKAVEAGLILVDTKYEFGVDKDGHFLLIDEVHTPDSSRYWESTSYKGAMAKSTDPRPLDKDMIRAYLKDRCNPYIDPLPPIPQSLMDQTCRMYETFLARFTTHGK